MSEAQAESAVTRHKPVVSTPAELVAARELRGMSQIDISHRIKLQVRQVAALEEGRWDDLPGRSFVRGALRSYSRLIDADVAPLLEAIGGYAQPSPLVSGPSPHEASVSRSAGLGLDGGGRGGHPVLWGIAGVIGVVALVLYFGSGREGIGTDWLPSSLTGGGQSSSTVTAPAPMPGSDGSPDSRSVSTLGGVADAAIPSTAPAAGSQSAAPAPTTTTVAPLVPPATVAPAGVPPSSTAAATTAAPASAPAGAVSPSTAPAASSAMAPAAAAPSAATAVSDASAASGSAAGSAAPVNSGKGVIVFRAAEDSWVEVRQADGTALHSAVMKAGTELELKGTPPYRLTMGNPGKLTLVYEGTVRDLGPLTSKANIARLTLN